MTAPAAPWRELAQRLADELVAEGVLRTPAWRAAIEQIPRHVFVPRFYVQQSGGRWIETTGEAESWLTAVYRNEPLITELAVAASGNRVTVSSSTKPGLMVRMLEVLDVHDENRVLEIGTGTGYNAGLLSHRLGADRVFSIDIGTGLVDAARDRLATLGLAPTLSVTHGAGAMPEHAPFDRIIATCSLPAVPWSWAEQVREGVWCSSMSNAACMPVTSSCSPDTLTALKGDSYTAGPGSWRFATPTRHPTAPLLSKTFMRASGRQQTWNHCRGHRWCRGSSPKRACPANSLLATAAPPRKDQNGRYSAVVTVRGAQYGYRLTTPAGVRCVNTGRSTSGTSSRPPARCGTDSVGRAGTASA